MARRTAEIIDFAAAKALRQQDMQQELAKYDHLGCPKCGMAVAPHKVNEKNEVSYRCEGIGHRPLDWRIDANGEMMRGAKGNRYYR